MNAWSAGGVPHPLNMHKYPVMMYSNHYLLDGESKVGQRKIPKYHGIKLGMKLEALYVN